MSAEVLDEIVNLESEMFRGLNVEPPITEDAVPSFQAIRWMTYSVLSDETLSSWQHDLCEAKKSGRNLLNEKYALVDGLINHFNTNPLIPEIVEAEVAWMRKLHDLYPHIVSREPDDAALFQRYLYCELENWSDQSLELYFADVTAALDKGRNLCEERYNNMQNRLGRGSLHDLERAAVQESQ